MSTLMPGSVAEYAPGRRTVAGVAEPPPETEIWSMFQGGFVSGGFFFAMIQISEPFDRLEEVEHTAAHVELCATWLTSNMQCDNLGAEEVVAGGDV